MSLRNCPTCGHGCASDAKRCPSCGGKLPLVGWRKWVAVAFIIWVFMIVYAGVRPKSDAEKKAAIESAGQIYADQIKRAAGVSDR